MDMDMDMLTVMDVDMFRIDMLIIMFQCVRQKRSGGKTTYLPNVYPPPQHCQLAARGLLS